jgi:RNA polymerase sigma-70 factor (ECF subfamily)
LEITDRDLVTRCIAGDRAAWEWIVHEYHRRIYNLAYRYTGKFDSAEDLTQEIFLKVYRTLNTYKSGSGPLIGWIVRVSRNHIIDQYRKFKTETRQTDSLETEFDRLEENPARYADPGQALESRELSERVHLALLRIPVDLKDAVILRDLEEFSYEEIAAMLELPLGTVKSRINRGRIELAKILGKAH